MISKKKYEVFHPDHEIPVHYLLNIKNAINSENFSHLFEKAGLLDKKADEWVSAQILLDIFNEMEARQGAMLDFVAIGMRSATDVAYPPEFLALPFEVIITSLVEQYYNFSRGTDVGIVQCKATAPQHMVYSFQTAYPDDWWYGVAYGVMKRFTPSNLGFKVYYDPQKPRREKGGEETVIHLEWWEKDSK